MSSYRHCDSRDFCEEQSGKLNTAITRLVKAEALLKRLHEHIMMDGSAQNLCAEIEALVKELRS